MRTVCLLFVLSLLGVLSLAGHEGKHQVGRHKGHGGRRLIPCQRRRHHVNKTIGGKSVQDKPQRRKDEDKGLFGDGKTTRFRDIYDLFFTSTSRRTKTGTTVFYLSTYYLDKPSATVACQRLGGQLAHISSLDKYTFLEDWLESLSPYDQQQIHIGGTLDRNLDWTQDNGSEHPFLLWHNGEPTVRHTDTWQESCLLLERRGGKFKMNDVACHGIKKRFLCEEHKDL